MPPQLTKVRAPVRRSDALARPRLLDALLENSDRKLLLLIAPAGYGKTTLLADFATDAPAPVAWLTLDAGDRDPRIFIEYVVRALQQADPAVGLATLSALMATVEVEQRTAELARTLSSDISQHLSGVCFLALDDFHEVNESRTVTAFLDELLRVLPDNLRLLIAGRTIPDLTVSRLAVEHNLFGFSETDLRFTAAEVAALVEQRYGARLDEARAQTLTDQAEGWIAGLLLSMHGALDGAVSGPPRIMGDHGPLYDYLANVAYTRQPSVMREFLLTSSTLPVLTESACAAVFGPGDWMGRLADAEQENLFMARLGGGEPAYRYHPLFREFLQGRLLREQPAQYRALHLRAARLRTAERDWPGAMEHYQAAGVLEEAAAVLARIAPELEREGRWYLLAQTIDQLSSDVRDGNPSLLVSRARAAGITGDLKGAESLARRAIEVAGDRTDHQIDGWALQVLGNALRRLGRTDEAIDVLRAADTLAHGDQALMASVRRDLAGCYGVQGDFQAAAAEFGAAYEYFAGAGSIYEAARAAYGLGAALARMGRGDEACVQYSEALRHWRDAGDKGNIALTLNNIGYVRSFQGRYEEARVLFEEGLEQAREVGNRVAEAYLCDSLGSLLLNQGNVIAAADSYRLAMELAQDAGDLWTATSAMEGVGLCALLIEDLHAAAEWFERATVLADRQESPYRRAQLAVDHALVLLRSDQVGAAQAALSAAQQLLEPLKAGRDLVRVRLWRAHAHYRDGDRDSARALYQEAAADAVALNLPALLDLPARWDQAAFAAFSVGTFADVASAAIARRVPIEEPRRPMIVQGPALPSFRVYSFGRAQVIGTDDAAMEWGREKGRELFFYLMHNGPTRSQRIVADLWPHTPPAQGKASLYAAVYAIRRAIHPETVIAVGRTYRLHQDLIVYHDVPEFDVLYAQIRGEPNPTRRTGLMEQLVALHRGPLLDDIEAEWAAPLRRTYEARYLDTLEALVGAYAEAGDWSKCLSAALGGLSIDPDSEPLSRHAGTAYRALGKPWAAKRLARSNRDRQAHARR